MKNNSFVYCIVIFLLPLVVSCNTQAEYKTAIISGTVANWNPKQDQTSITIVISDILQREISHLTELDDEGNFRFELDIKSSIDFLLIYNTQWLCYISPGDSLNITIDSKVSSLEEHTSMRYNFVEIGGSSSVINKNIHDFIRIYEDSLNPSKETYDSVKNQEPLEYKKFKTSQFIITQTVLDEFITTNKTSDEFRNWANSYIQYGYWKELLSYRTMHAYYKGIAYDSFLAQIPNDYFDFLQTGIQNISGNSFFRQNGFLQEYCEYIGQLIPPEAYSEIDPAGKEANSLMIAIRLNHYEKNAEGYVKDILVSKLIYQLLDQKYFIDVSKSYNENMISDPILHNRVDEKYQAEWNLFNNPVIPKEAHLLDSEKIEPDSILNWISNEFKGKVVYMDFWAPWCGPCMQEIPYTIRLGEENKNNDFACLFLAVDCSEESWKATISQYSMNGYHMLLSNDQYLNLRKTFPIDGIPHYVLMNNQGEIKNSDAPHPSNRKVILEELSILFDNKHSISQLHLY